jgi:hypothetical protein
MASGEALVIAHAIRGLCDDNAIAMPKVEWPFNKT